MVGISRTDAAHLLKRTGFGGTAAEVDALTPLTWTQAVDRVLDTSQEPPRTAGVPTLPAPGAALSVAQWSDAYRQMVRWWLDRCRTTPAPLVEKMTLFWHGHLCSSLELVPHRLMFDQNQTLRARGLGPIAQLVRAVAVDPAMLIYLDNRGNLSINGRVYGNENFARELLELFLLGVGNYTEDDVRSCARAWSGHTLNASTWRYEFRSDWHDHGLKWFLHEQRNWDGPQIIDHLVTGPHKRTTARFLARKLWEFLVHPDPAGALVEALAEACVAGGMQVKPLLRAILLRPEFLTSRARAGVVRSPAEWVVAAMRHGQVSCADTAPEWQMKGMGQELFLPPNVDGWGPSRNWVSTTATWAKLNFATTVASKAPVLADTASLSPERAVDAALEQFGIFTPSTATRQAMLDFVRTDRASRARKERPGLITLALLCPEFQLA